MQNEIRRRRKILEGTVISSKMEKTVVVVVKRLVKDSVLGKYVRKTKKYYVHDEQKRCSVGDMIKIRETRPLSKLKRWTVCEIVRSAPVVE